MPRPEHAYGSAKRKDAKQINKDLPVGVNYAHSYMRDGTVIENGRIRAIHSWGEYASFSINKYGEAEAIRRAVAWRKQRQERTT